MNRDKTTENALRWLQAPFSKETQAKVRLLLEKVDDEKDAAILKQRFSTKLSFGTGGVRALTGIGSSRMNVYTVAALSAGLQRYLASKNTKSENSQQDTQKVLIGFDGRYHSARFAETAAIVFLSMGSQVQLFSYACPTPLLSYWGRVSDAFISIMVTASHNPYNYNGYKVYGKDGRQVAHPLDAQIMHYVNRVDDFPALDYAMLEKSPEPKHGNGDDWQMPLPFPQLKRFLASNLKLNERLKMVDARASESYLKAMKASLSRYEAHAADKKSKIHYSALHGVGYGLFSMAVDQAGYKNFFPVHSQCTIDAGFSSVAMPNPEEDAALEQVLQQFKENPGTIAIATDADADRVRVAAPLCLPKEAGDDDVTAVALTGNEMATLLVDYVIEKNNGKNLSGKMIVKTIVTTPMIEKIANSYGIEVINTLPGFKNIGSVVASDRNASRFLLGLEDSCGYCVGDFIRDKDGIQASSMFINMAEYWQACGVSLWQRLDELFLENGYHLESIVSLEKKNPKDIVAIMQKFRTDSLDSLAGAKRVGLYDLKKPDAKGKAENVLPNWSGVAATDALWMCYEDGTTVLVRPSGTEPKIKFYVQLFCPSPGEIALAKMEKTDRETWLKEVRTTCKSKLALLTKQLLAWLEQPDRWLTEKQSKPQF